MLSGGGGGFGNPFKRDPNKVAEDVREGYVSKAAAEELYGVVVDENSAVDLTQTLQRRAQSIG
jgi:N-methylhydantoinase B